MNTVPTTPRRASLRDVSPGRLHGVGARVVLDELMADSRPAPLALTDWLARIERDFATVTARIDSLKTQTDSAADDFVSEAHFYGQIKLNALNELIEKLSDDSCDVLGAFDAEAADIELLAIDFGLPLAKNAEVTL